MIPVRTPLGDVFSDQEVGDDDELVANTVGLAYTAMTYHESRRGCS